MDSSYTPIGDYGVIGNGERCALVSLEGSIDWLPLPHVESSTVFAAIVDDEEGGRFSIEPTESYEPQQSYVEGTNVLRTTVETGSGRATTTDFMPVHPGDGDPPHENFQRAVYRKVEGERGAVEFEVTVEPRFDYARAETTIGATGDDERLEDGLVATGGGERLSVHAHGPGERTVAFDLEEGQGGPAATATVAVEEGESCWFCLQYGHSAALSAAEREEVLSGTIDYWREWLATCEEGNGALFGFGAGDEIARSALALKLLIHEGEGSIPAAPTASLPEVVGDDLNWDYRYNWIRDAKFAIQALYSVGQEAEARQYFDWFRGIGHDEPGELQPLYGLHGETEIGEESLDHLEGYRGSAPVRIGNAAAEQVQHDAYGTIVQGIYETVRYEDGLTDEDWNSVRALANHVCEIWDEPDAGIWEFRDEPRHYVHSKLLCWVALDRAIDLAEEYDREAPVERWDDERGTIREEIVERGYDEGAGAFLQHYDTDEALDATALLIPLYDFLPADDERVQGTIDAVIEEMATDDGLVFRFTDSEARPDEPTAFVLCSFWLIDALVLSGRIEEAEELFGNVLEHASPLGLLSEMIDPETGELLGNYPQAFSHIGLINSAIYLASADEDRAEFPPEALSWGASAPLFRRHG